MTAKEKASEIFHKMWDQGLSRGQAKSCALNVVDEVINTIYIEDFDGHLVDEIGASIFWKKVREELKEL